jgi:hypothetical protein
MNIQTTVNVSDDVIFDHIKINSARALPWVFAQPEHDGHAVIVGGAPSVATWIDEIKMRKEAGQKIFALNGAAKFLKLHGIDVDYCVVVDAREINDCFIGYANEHLLASQCHPKLFDGATNVTLWHQEYPDDMDRLDSCLPDHSPAHTLIGGGTTCGLSAMVLAYALGYRKLHLYGYDSSYTDDRCHAYNQFDPSRVECVATVAGRSFKTTLAMAKQAELFPELSDSLIDLGCTLTLRGDGLLPWTSEMSSKQPEPMTEQEKYKRMWSHESYRNAAPGEVVASLFLLAAKPNCLDQVIDYGSGTGRGALKIHSISKANVLMLDFADNSLDEDVRSKLNENFRFEIADLTKPIEHKAKFGYCTDVMEHIQPDLVDDVIKNIMNSSEQVFFQISTVPDMMGALIGQQLHLTVEPAQWWREKFLSLGYAVQWELEEDIAAMFFITQLLEEENA